LSHSSPCAPRKAARAGSAWPFVFHRGRRDRARRRRRTRGSPARTGAPSTLAGPTSKSRLDPAAGLYGRSSAAFRRSDRTATLAEMTKRKADCLGVCRRGSDLAGCELGDLLSTRRPNQLCCPPRWLRLAAFGSGDGRRGLRPERINCWRFISPFSRRSAPTKGRVEARSREKLDRVEKEAAPSEVGLKRRFSSRGSSPRSAFFGKTEDTPSSCTPPRGNEPRVRAPTSTRP